jgi:hypothetical protein
MTNLPNNIPPINGIYLKPGEKISADFVEKLAEINANYTKSKNFPKYQEHIRQHFQLQHIQLNQKSHYYLAGFVEGEASLNVGVKKNTTSNFKLYIDPEFNITQHINGVFNLYLAMCYFQTGRIRHKTGSNATFVYTIDNRVSLEQKVVPFYEKYLNTLGSSLKQRRVAIFKTLLSLFNERAHLDLNRMLHEVLPLWDAMRMQAGQSNESFKSLQDAQEYVKKAAQDSQKT